MHDLRKQAILESGKTTSRKKQRNLQAGSGSATPTLSRAASAVTSRNASDDEDDDVRSTSSLNDVGSLVASLPADIWTADLNERIEAICDRKRSSTGGRENALNAFSNLISYHYAEEELKPRVSELMPALLKCVKSGESAREVELALRAISLIMVTSPSAEIFAAAQPVIKTTAEDSNFSSAKIAALRALGMIQFFSESHLDDTEELMDFFLDIVSSDGQSIGEEDSVTAVLVALEEWGYLATLFDSLPPSASMAIDIFIDQLESSEPDVICAACENIALLVEISYGEADSDDEQEEDESTGVEFKPRSHALDNEARRVLNILHNLSKQSLKSVSKSERRSLKTTINDVVQTVEDPRRGPGYSTALDNDGYEYGSRLKVAVDNRGSKFTIDQWWKLLRLNALKRLLQSGFLAHCKFNDNVANSLPAATRDMSGTDSDRPRYATKHLQQIEDILEHH